MKLINAIKKSVKQNNVYKLFKILNSIKEVKTSDDGSLFIKMSSNVMIDTDASIITHCKGHMIRKATRIMDNPDVGKQCFVLENDNVLKHIDELNKKVIDKEHMFIINTEARNLDKESFSMGKDATLCEDGHW